MKARSASVPDGGCGMAPESARRARSGSRSGGREGCAHEKVSEGGTTKLAVAAGRRLGKTGRSGRVQEMPGELPHLAAISGRAGAREQTEVAAQVSLIEVSGPHRHRRERGSSGWRPAPGALAGTGPAGRATWGRSRSAPGRVSRAAGGSCQPPPRPARGAPGRRQGSGPPPRRAVGPPVDRGPGQVRSENRQAAAAAARFRELLVQRRFERRRKLTQRERRVRQLRAAHPEPPGERLGPEANADEIHRCRSAGSPSPDGSAPPGATAAGSAPIRRRGTRTRRRS